MLLSPEFPEPSLFNDKGSYGINIHFLAFCHKFNWILPLDFEVH